MNTNRRTFFTHGSMMGFTAFLGAQICRGQSLVGQQGLFRRCLVLWMEGGPSQFDTFDPKPSLPEARECIPTNVPGLSFADALPRLAERADQLCVVRTVGSREGEHARASELLHTGFAPVPAFPRPALGAMATHETDDSGFPRNVTLGNVSFGSSFLGAQHAPFVIENLEEVNKQLDAVHRRKSSLELLTSLNSLFQSHFQGRSTEQRATAIDSVKELLNSPFPEALDLEKAESGQRDRYGSHEFGQRVLAAFRLLKMGVPFVEAQLSGWDTHIDNQARTSRLCRQMEPAMIALMDDLQSHGMWDDTLIVWMGEFGRTPRLNGKAGRDHFPEVIPVVLAGGQLGGRQVGQTSDESGHRTGQKNTVADLMATLLTLLGKDPDAVYQTEFGSPTTATDAGTPIQGIIG